MTSTMRKKLASLPYPEKLRQVAELIEFSRRLKETFPRNSKPKRSRISS